MAIFSGLLAGLFFVMLAGWSWPLPGDRANLTHAIIDASVKSLWIGWAVAIALYFLSIEGSTVLWVVVITLFSIALLRTAGHRLEATKYDIFVVCFYGVLIFAAAVALPIFEVGYEIVFNQWDAIFSWNRWAMELSQNEYKPYDAGYPVLIPGVWSLVYRAQETSEIWFVAKLTLFVIPALLLLGSHLVWALGRKFLAIGIFCFVLYFFFIRQNKDLLIGYMDGPVTALMFLVSIIALCVIDAVEARDKTRATALLTTMAVLSGAAATIKQPGCAAVVILGGLVGLLWWRGQLSFVRVCQLMAIALIPPLLFLALFYSADGNALSNLDSLSVISEREAQGQEQFWLALRHIHPLPLLGLFALGCLNIAKFRTMIGQVGLLMLALGVAFFAVYIDCCTYDERNSHAVLTLLAGSAIFGLASYYAEPSISFPKWDARLSLSARRVIGGLALGVCFLSLITQAFIDDQRARDIQTAGQWQIAKPDVRELIKKNHELIKRGDVLISSHRRLQWLPGLDGKFKYCRDEHTDCAIESLKKADRAYVMLRAGAYNNLERQLNPEKRIGHASGFALYGPIMSNDISP